MSDSREQVYTALVSGASETGLTLQFPLPEKPDGAKQWASVRVPFRPSTSTPDEIRDEALETLRQLPIVSVRMPFIEAGIMRFKLSPKMSGERLYVLACALFEGHECKLKPEVIQGHMVALGLELAPTAKKPTAKKPTAKKPTAPVVPDVIAERVNGAVPAPSANGNS